jgi:hypothetical protein
MKLSLVLIRGRNDLGVPLLLLSNESAKQVDPLYRLHLLLCGMATSQ